MQDELEPFSYIKNLAVEVLDLLFPQPSPCIFPMRRARSGHYLFTIEESQEYFSKESESPINPHLKIKNLKTEVLVKMAYDSQAHYDYYKFLMINLSYYIGAKEKTSLQILNHQLQEKANTGSCNRVLEAMSLWKKQRLDILVYSKSAYSHQRRLLIIECYLYQIALERVFFEHLGLIDDPILKKLFSQGLVLYALVDMYFYDEPQALALLSNLGVPLAIRFDHSLLNLNQGKNWSYSRPIRNLTTDNNLYRLTVTRIRRLWLTFNDLHCFKDVSLWMMVVDPMVQITMRFLNLIYFVPRLATQFLCMFKHLFIIAWMTEQEKRNTFFQRMKMQLNRRWEICLRDAIWCLNSLLNFFMLTGSYANWSLLINAAFQLIETGLNIYLYYDFLDQKNKRQKFFSNFHKEALLQIHLMDELEEKNRYIRMNNSILILLSNVLVLQVFFVMNPYIPVLGAMIGLMMSFIQLCTRIQLEKERMALKEVFDLPKPYSTQSLINQHTRHAKISKANWFAP